MNIHPNVQKLIDYQKKIKAGKEIVGLSGQEYELAKKEIQKDLDIRIAELIPEVDPDSEYENYRDKVDREAEERARNYNPYGAY